MKPISAKDRLAALRIAERPPAPVVVAEDAEPAGAEPASITGRAPDLAITEILATLNEPVSPGVPTAIAYGRKEKALIALFDRLGADDALALHERLATGSSDDPLLSAFGRIATERRLRLTEHLARCALRHHVRVTGVSTIAG